MDLVTALENTSGTRNTVARAVAESAAGVLAFSREVHADPEVSFAEHRASSAAAALLASAGYRVDFGSAGLATAFVATIGSGSFTAALCVEYDALPGVGHACGHNLIAGASVAGALGLAPLADELDISVRVIGTPAEEHGGGKALLIQAGVFDDVAMAMMMHPFPEGLSYNPAGTSTQAVGRFRATFKGQSAHAAAAPERAVNAADAAVVAQVAVGLLRQQLPENHRVALYVAEAGSVTNVIPDLAVVNFECRAFTMGEFELLRDKVFRCFEAGALATGARLDITAVGPVYEPLIQNELLCELWSDGVAFFGRDVARAPGLSGGSTDMGNVSQLIPSLHPWVGIPGVTSPIHSHGFAVDADTPQAYEVMFEAAVSLAWTAVAVAENPTHRQQLLQAAHSRSAHLPEGTPS